MLPPENHPLYGSAQEFFFQKQEHVQYFLPTDLLVFLTHVGQQCIHHQKLNISYSFDSSYPQMDLDSLSLQISDSNLFRVLPRSVPRASPTRRVEIFVVLRFFDCELILCQYNETTSKKY